MSHSCGSILMWSWPGRLLGPFVRDGGLPLERAVQHATSLSAAQFGILHRGMLIAAALLGGGELRILPAELPGGVRRTLVEIAKVLPSPPAYPRRPGVPLKRPLGE